MFDWKAYFDEDKFEEGFIEWYDKDMPKHNFNKVYGNYLPAFMVYEMNAEDNIYGEPRRWTRWVKKIVEINGRYFSVKYDQGLTEHQEDLFNEEEIREVRPQMKVKIVREWEEVKH